MYLPKIFEQTDVGILHALIRSHPLGALVTSGDAGPDADHIPFLVTPEPAPYGTLHGHVARANPLWRRAQDHALRALVIFSGPQQFISPSWYPSKSDTGRVVPTWNYVVVHAHGLVRVVDEASWVRPHLELLTNTHEQRRPHPWAVTDAPADYVEKMAANVVGLQIQIERLVGKWKVSQNRSAADRNGVVQALVADGSPATLVMADLICESAPE